MIDSTAVRPAVTPLYQHLLLTAERKFWRCVESGEPPRAGQAIEIRRHQF
jgi:hypothetical protein